MFHDRSLDPDPATRQTGLALATPLQSFGTIPRAAQPRVSKGLVAPQSGCSLAHWMAEEEAQHLGTGIRPGGVGEGAIRATAGPGVAGAMQEPVLDPDGAARIGIGPAGEGAPTLRAPPRLVRR